MRMLILFNASKGLSTFWIPINLTFQIAFFSYEKKCLRVYNLLSSYILPIFLLSSSFHWYL